MNTTALPATANALWARIGALWARVRSMRRPGKQLRLTESLPLGERRFVAIVEFERSRFLVGGTASSLTLLARLEDSGGSDRPCPRGEPC